MEQKFWTAHSKTVEIAAKSSYYPILALADKISVLPATDIRIFPSVLVN